MEKLERVSIVELLQQPGGTYEIGGEQYFVMDGTQCRRETDLDYEQITVRGDFINFAQATLNETKTGFEQPEDEEDNEEEREFVWKDGQWQAASDRLEVISENEFGVVEMSSDLLGRQRYWVQRVDVSGKTLKHFTNTEVAWDESIQDDSLRFPTGSYAYQMNGEQLEDRYLLGERLGHGSIYSLMTEGVVPSYFKLDGRGKYELWVQMFGQVGDKSGRLVIHLDEKGKENYWDIDGDFQGTWVWGNIGVSFDVPEAVKPYMSSSEQLLVERDGLAQWATKTAAGTINDTSWQFNRTAIEALKAGINYAELDGDAEYSDCTNDPETTPNITPDPANTAAWQERVFHVVGGDIEGALEFGENQQLTYVDRHGQEQTGQWAIDADGQLLLDFQGSWELLQLNGDLNTHTIQAVTDGQIMTLRQILEPLSSDDVPLELELAALSESECKVVFSLQENGVGFIDYNKCPSREGLGLVPFEYGFNEDDELRLEIPGAIDPISIHRAGEPGAPIWILEDEFGVEGFSVI